MREGRGEREREEGREGGMREEGREGGRDEGGKEGGREERVKEGRKKRGGTVWGERERERKRCDHLVVRNETTDQVELFQGFSALSLLPPPLPFPHWNNLIPSLRQEC